ncbi:MAG TPA: tripartite tricarboxylate transporter substrate-binding protein [Ramlibacter sp.]|uniref:Bug family tripartite tricarboxylate transporter substrate binding protein n=1 Tax=Ramlibacter sp. TaxID=1917967 RepID=UPI002C670058|nr:tripartite tricarboxylate transporter substrate-binding protein [Ramlibacter sp.]HVZ46694.1 tripartite tricarboxylate transporter substrate-binding protein [Ramlibacter sp.]
MFRRDFLSFLGGAACAPALAQGNVAQTGRFQPGAPVRLVVPNDPGGAMDIIARLLASALAPLWSPANVIVDYHPGAGTVLGTNFVAKSRPDGLTIGMIATPHVINPAIRSLPFDPERDFVPLTRIGTSDLLLSASPAFGADRLADALARVKANPGKYSCATAGAGSSMHFALEMLKQRAGLELLHVPFKGSGPAFIELAAGRIEFLVEPVFSSMPHVKAGRLVPLATSGRQRSRYLPQVPTLAETFPGLFVESFFGLVAPGGTDGTVAQHIAADVATALANPQVAERTDAIGIAVAPMPPAEFAAFLSSQTERWREVAKKAGMRIE